MTDWEILYGRLLSHCISLTKLIDNKDIPLEVRAQLWETRRFLCDELLPVAEKKALGKARRVITTP